MTLRQWLMGLFGAKYMTRVYIYIYIFRSAADIRTHCVYHTPSTSRSNKRIHTDVRVTLQFQASLLHLEACSQPP